MSYFIQDNQCVIETDDEKYILLIKGGDNNVSSAYTNRRSTHWYLHHVFTNKASYDAYIEKIIYEDVVGGSWQFNSLKNRVFPGYIDYELVILERFEKAFGRRLKTEWKLDEITPGNVVDFEKSIEDAMRVARYSFNDEDGHDTLTPGIVSRFADSKAAAASYASERLAAFYTNNVPKGLLEEYRKYSGQGLDALVCQGDFLATILGCATHRFKPHLRLLRGVSFLTSARMDYTLFKRLFLTSDVVVDLLTSFQSEMPFIEKHAENFSRLWREDEVMLTSAIRQAWRAIRKSDRDLARQRLCEFRGLDFEELGEQARLKVSNAHVTRDARFIEIWNSIEPNSLYTNTHQKLVFVQQDLEAFSLDGEGDINALKIRCRPLRNLAVNYAIQRKKNQEAIRRFMGYLLENYPTFIDADTRKSWGPILGKSAGNNRKRRQGVTRSLFV